MNNESYGLHNPVEFKSLEFEKWFSANFKAVNNTGDPRDLVLKSAARCAIMRAS